MSQKNMSSKQQLIIEEQKKLFKNRKIVQLNKSGGYKLAKNK